MLTDEQLIQRLQAALENESAGIVPPFGLLASIHDELRSSPRSERHRWRAPSRGHRLRLAHLGPVGVLLAVVAVVAVFLGVQSRKPVGSAAAKGGFEFVYRAEPTPQVPVVNEAAMARAVSVMRQRIAAALPAAEASVGVASVGAKIFVHVGSGAPISRKQLLLLVGPTARLLFYDWEANALTPSGQTVVSQLATQNPQALELSGQGSAPAGTPGTGSMALYQAVTLAAKQPYEASRDNARYGAEYFAFGAPGSSACTMAASHYHVTAITGQHCYLAGPVDNVQDLDSVLPGVSPSQAQVIAVKQGTVVLRAIPPSYTHAPPWYDPSAQFFVLRDHVALFGNQIINPHQSTDQSGQPVVRFGLTSKGQAEFQNLTATIAHRGAVIAGFSHHPEYQHFAVAIETQLITVPYIDYTAYPDGIRGLNHVDLPGNFTISSARDLAAQLRLGALPIDLKLIAIRR